MKENLRFFFNNALSSDMWLTNVHLEDSLYEESFIASRSINEQKILGKTKSYLMGINYEPIQFELAFAFTQVFDEGKLREVSRWLDVGHYKEFYFLDNPKYRVFAMPTESINIIHNGLNQGYLTLTMKTNDRFSYSQEHLTEEYDLTNNTDLGTDIVLENEGDTELYTEMWIEKIGDGDIVVENNSDNGRIFQVLNLIDGEKIYIDNEREEIMTDIPNRYLFDNVTTKFLRLNEGDNALNIRGTCKIQFRYRFKYKTFV